MHGVPCESPTHDPVVFQHVSVEAEIEKNLFVFLVLEVVFEEQNQILAFSEIVDEYSGPVSKRHFRACKELGANDLPVPHGRFFFDVHVNGFCVPGVDFVCVRTQDLEDFLSLFGRADDGDPWNGEIGEGGILVAREFLVIRLTAAKPEELQTTQNHSAIELIKYKVVESELVFLLDSEPFDAGESVLRVCLGKNGLELGVLSPFLQVFLMQNVLKVVSEHGLDVYVLVSEVAVEAIFALEIVLALQLHSLNSLVFLENVEHGLVSLALHLDHREVSLQSFLAEFRGN